MQIKQLWCWSWRQCLKTDVWRLWFVVGPGLRWSGEGALQHSKVGWLPYNSHLTKSYSRADDNGCPPLEDEEERWCSLYLCSRLLGLIILILCKVKVTHTFPFIVLTGDNNRLATNIIVRFCVHFISFSWFWAGIGILVLLSLPSSYGFLALQNLLLSSPHQFPQQGNGSAPASATLLLPPTTRLPPVMRLAPFKPPMPTRKQHTTTKPDSAYQPFPKASQQSNGVTLPGTSSSENLWRQTLPIQKQMIRQDCFIDHSLHD